MIITTTNDSYAAVNAAHSLLHELIHRQLGDELSDADFASLENALVQIEVVIQRQKAGDKS